MKRFIPVLLLLLLFSDFSRLKAEESEAFPYDILTYQLPYPFIPKEEPVYAIEYLDMITEYQTFVEELIHTAITQPHYPVVNHTTIYGDLFGTPANEWCTEFVMYCLKTTEEKLGTSYINDIYPWKDSAWNVGIYYKRHDRYYDAHNDFYIPHAGDIILFDTVHYGYPDHTALVMDSYKIGDQYYVRTIEGNIPQDRIKQVRSRILPIDDDQIFAYCSSLYESEYTGPVWEYKVSEN